MAYNFNNYANEYELHGNVTAEMIDLYGLEVTYIKTEKVNKDTLLSEYGFLRADNTNVYKIYMYPENTQQFNAQNDLLTKFGIIMQDEISLYVSKREFIKVFPSSDFQRGVNDLIMLPSQQIFEISDIEAQVVGVNNMFTYNNTKNVYLVKCKPYNYNYDQIEITDEEDEPINFDELFDIPKKEEEKVVQETQSKSVPNLDPIFGDLG